MLFFVGRPSTVFFAVVAIRIDTVYRGAGVFSDMFEVGRIHVVYEFLKGWPKATNAASAVVFVPWFVFVVTAALYAAELGMKC